jgi:hypothetical protein
MMPDGGRDVRPTRSRPPVRRTDRTARLVGLYRPGTQWYAGGARRRRVTQMRRLVSTFLAAVALSTAPALPAHADVRWVCEVPGEGSVTFVTAPDAAAHGITTANARAGQTFNLRFGEVCTVVGP